MHVCPVRLEQTLLQDTLFSNLQATKKLTFNKSELAACCAQAYIPGPGTSSSPGAPPDHRLVDETNTELDM